MARELPRRRDGRWARGGKQSWDPDSDALKELKQLLVEVATVAQLKEEQQWEQALTLIDQAIKLEQSDGGYGQEESETAKELKQLRAELWRPRWRR